MYLRISQLVQDYLDHATVKRLCGGNFVEVVEHIECANVLLSVLEDGQCGVN